MSELKFLDYGKYAGVKDLLNALSKSPLLVVGEESILFASVFSKCVPFQDGWMPCSLKDSTSGWKSRVKSQGLLNS